MTTDNTSSLDCLCIIQNDPLDWESEAAAMGDLYLNAYVTISAAVNIMHSRSFRDRSNFASLKVIKSRTKALRGREWLLVPMTRVGEEDL
jgi:hypothetical protein